MRSAVSRKFKAVPDPQYCALCGDRYEGELAVHREGCWVVWKCDTQEDLPAPQRVFLEVGGADEDANVPVDLRQWAV